MYAFNQTYVLTGDNAVHELTINPPGKWVTHVGVRAFMVVGAAGNTVGLFITDDSGQIKPDDSGVILPSGAVGAVMPLDWLNASSVRRLFYKTSAAGITIFVSIFEQAAK